jgi:hypothetical protein
VRAVAERHERALEGLAVDRAADLDEAAVPKSSAEPSSLT